MVQFVKYQCLRIFSNCQKLGSARGYNIVKNTTKLL